MINQCIKKAVFVLLGLFGGLSAQAVLAAEIDNEFIRQYNSVAQAGRSIWIDPEQSGYFAWRPDKSDLLIYSVVAIYSAAPLNEPCPNVSGGAYVSGAPIPAPSPHQLQPSIRVPLSSGAGPSALCKLLYVSLVPQPQVLSTPLSATFANTLPGAVKTAFGLQRAKEAASGLLGQIIFVAYPGGGRPVFNGVQQERYGFIYQSWPLDEFGRVIAPRGSLTGAQAGPGPGYWVYNFHVL